MGINTPSDAMELIRLTDSGQSVRVLLPSATVTMESLGVRYYDAVAVVASDFVNGTVHLGFDSEDLADWGRFLDAVEQAEEDADPDEPYTADWPSSGRTAYLRFIAEDPYVVEVHDGTGTHIVVSVPLDLREEWTADARRLLTEVRAALGE